MASINYNTEITQKSKGLGHVLSKFLRTRGKFVGSDGYATLPDLHKHSSNRFTIETLLFVIENDEKNRFQYKFENEILCVRARQGHRNHVGGVLDDWVEILQGSIEIAVHGTSREALSMILQPGNGLSKMDREWIHFAPRIDNESGFRKNSKVAIYLNIQKCLDDGIKLYLTGNNVILSQGQGTTGMITSNYFLRIVDLETDDEIHF